MKTQYHNYQITDLKKTKKSLNFKKKRYQRKVKTISRYL